jgi:hypothetical protein
VPLPFESIKALSNVERVVQDVLLDVLNLNLVVLRVLQVLRGSHFLEFYFKMNGFFSSAIEMRKPALGRDTETCQTFPLL